MTKFIVWALVAGKWLAVDDHSGDKPTPRLFDTETQAAEYAKRFSGKTKITEV